MTLGRELIHKDTACHAGYKYDNIAPDNGKGTGYVLRDMQYPGTVCPQVSVYRVPKRISAHDDKNTVPDGRTFQGFQNQILFLGTLFSFLLP